MKRICTHEPSFIQGHCVRTGMECKICRFYLYHEEKQTRNNKTIELKIKDIKNA